MNWDWAGSCLSAQPLGKAGGILMVENRAYVIDVTGEEHVFRGRKRFQEPLIYLDGL